MLNASVQTFRTLILSRILTFSLLATVGISCLADEEPSQASSAVVNPTQETIPAVASSQYRLQPGDVVQVSVWKETDLQSDVLIRPDGGFSFPLVGDFVAVGKTIEELNIEVTRRIQRFVPDAVVNISLKQPQGHRVYVVGRVNRPGEFLAVRPLDVMQALSMAGGATPFASLNRIKVLRRIDGKQQAFKFRYSDIEDGRKLEQNMVLQGGDIVVVP